MSGGFPIDLILFAMVAAFLVLRLRSVLGRRTGFERPPAPEPRATGFDPRGGRVLDGTAEEVRAAPAQAGGPRHMLPVAGSPPAEGLRRIAAADQGFTPDRFLDGAEAAFRMVVGAFAAGDRQTLRALLGDATYTGFEQAITAREQAGESQRTEIRAVHEMAIEAAELRGTLAEVVVRFVTDQVNMTTARDGSVVTGSDAVTELTDIWTFQRPVGSADPTWKLVDTAHA
ncbi:Tim44/TimA family putative adaptor protein [Roseicella aquatilis]|uniref:Tim44 domain-containing protein n=1 Tax=Roseicella aquatilis TaxID=2527868 RepID=A0A4R4D9G3_9PROT|nr:Tim44/TimA family putative adaptor protein [Roseicella aquatilis]TCZ56764.1 Tim44 domain-containing protein [Roseicella aquatilis]